MAVRISSMLGPAERGSGVGVWIPSELGPAERGSEIDQQEASLATQTETALTNRASPWPNQANGGGGTGELAAVLPCRYSLGASRS
jgi:hypothetical protein